MNDNIQIYAINSQGGLVEMPFNWPGFSPGRFNLDSSPEAVDGFFEKLDYIGKCAAVRNAHKARKAAESRGTFDFIQDAFYPRDTHTKAWVEAHAPWAIICPSASAVAPVAPKDLDWENLYF